MKTVFFNCVLVALFGAVLRFFADTARQRKLTEVLRILITFLLLLTFRDGFTENTLPPFPQFPEADDSVFAEIAQNTNEKICKQVESKLSEELQADLTVQFSAAPVSCDFCLDRETYLPTKISVIYANAEMLSSYSVKKYISEKYNAETEVIFV